MPLLRRTDPNYDSEGRWYVPRDYGKNPAGFATETWDALEPSRQRFIPAGGGERAARFAHAQHIAVAAIRARVPRAVFLHRLREASIPETTWKDYRLGTAWFSDKALCVAIELIATAHLTPTTRNDPSSS